MIIKEFLFLVRWIIFVKLNIEKKFSLDCYFGCFIIRLMDVFKGLGIYYFVSN